MGGAGDSMSDWNSMMPDEFAMPADDGGGGSLMGAGDSYTSSFTGGASGGGADMGGLSSMGTDFNPMDSGDGS